MEYTIRPTHTVKFRGMPKIPAVVKYWECNARTSYARVIRADGHPWDADGHMETSVPRSCIRVMDDSIRCPKCRRTVWPTTIPASGVDPQETSYYCKCGWSTPA